MAELRGVTRCQSCEWYIGKRLLRDRDNECPNCGEEVVQEK